MLRNSAEAKRTQVYRDDDKPFYRRSNKVLIGFCVYSMALFIGAKIYYMTKNRRLAPLLRELS